MTDSVDKANGAPAPRDWVELWRDWWRAAGVRGPLSGDVDQVFDAALIRTVGDQLGFLNINTTRAGDPELERRITEEVASYGRQLGDVLDALDVLIRADGHGGLSAPDRAALRKVTALRADIERLKLRASTERVDRLVADIEAVRRDAVAESDAVARLRRALDG
jgi:hypothetical protein